MVVLEDTARRLLNADKLQYMMFSVDYAIGMPGSVTTTHEFVKEQDDMAAKAWGIVIRLIKYRCGSNMWHFVSWIGLYALAASDSDDDVEVCFSLLRRHYRGYLAAVEQSTKHTWMKKVISASPFATTVVREIAEFYVQPLIATNTSYGTNCGIMQRGYSQLLARPR